MSWTLNMSAFLSDMKRITRNVTGDAAISGVNETLAALKIDSDTVTPKTPHLEGHLRADFIIQAKKVSGKNIEGLLVYNSPYAARWHEAEGEAINWSEAGVGAKYVETKITRYKEKYNAIMGEAIKRGIK